MKTMKTTDHIDLKAYQTLNYISSWTFPLKDYLELCPYIRQAVNDLVKEQYPDLYPYTKQEVQDKATKDVLASTNIRDENPYVSPFANSSRVNNYTPEEMFTHSKLILNISEVLEIAKELFPDKNWKVRTKVGEFNAVQFYDFNSCFRFNITEPCKFSFDAEYDNWDLGIDLKDLCTSTIKEKLIEVKESLK